MSDDHLRAAERAWREAPQDDDLLSRALAAHARAGTDAPWDLIAAGPRWRGLTDFVSRWYSRPLSPADGCTLPELAVAEERIQRRLPPPVREWFLLTGRRDDFPGFSGGLIHRSPAAAPASWSLQDFVALDALKIEDGWITLGIGHQGNGHWAYRTTDDSPEVQIFVRRGFWQEDEGQSVADPVGPLGDFCLAFLIEEFLTDRAHGRGPTVRHASHSASAELRSRARATYGKSTLYLAAEVEYSDVVRDADTLVRLDDSDFVVATRTESAWTRATVVLGPPPLLSVVGPIPPGLTAWPAEMGARAAVAGELYPTPDHALLRLREGADQVLHCHGRGTRSSLDVGHANVRRTLALVERALEVFTPSSADSIAALSPQFEGVTQVLRELATVAPTYAAAIAAAPALLTQLGCCGIPALEAAAAGVQTAIASGRQRA